MGAILEGKLMSQRGGARSPRKSGASCQKIPQAKAQSQGQQAVELGERATHLIHVTRREEPVDGCAGPGTLALLVSAGAGALPVPPSLALSLPPSPSSPFRMSL